MNDTWLKEGVFIGDEVEPGRIAEDTVLHPGCRIHGAETSIGPGCILGAEAPVTLDNCQLGRNVELKGGYFAGATFFEGANMGSGAHVRAGTLLEEEANGAHTVGLKQTVLMPFVTLGSLVNFCDVLMAGGTSRTDHGEVGSSYVHFNYTPHQDKATASLIGDVPAGVFLDQCRVFLGGQGGMVGPCRIAYGTVVAAGGICRTDVLEENRLHIPATPTATTKPYHDGHRGIDRIVADNLRYIGNIVALQAWYRAVRQPLMGRDRFDAACYEGGLKNLDRILAERIRRLGELAEKVGQPGASEDQVAFHPAWESLEIKLKQSDWAEDTEAKASLLAAAKKIPVGGGYVAAVQSLDTEARAAGRAWLQSLVDEVTKLWPSPQGG